MTVWMKNWAHDLRTEFLPVLQGAAQWLRSHPRHVLAVLGTVLMGAGAAAFAVATIVPASDQISVREITVDVQPLLVQQDAHVSPMQLHRSEQTRANDTVDTLLRRMGVSDASAASFLRADAAARQALQRAGRNVTAQVSDRHGLVQLVARWPQDDAGQFQRLTVERLAGAWSSRLESLPMQASTRIASGTIRSSLFAATDEARIPDPVAIQMAEIFSGDIDFIRDLRKGDRFHVVYESLEADGEPLRTGRVLSAQFINNGKTFDAIWFQEPGGKGSYFTPQGKSLRKAFLASPLEFSRVTSGFGGRMHPLAREWRMHNGVDYAAPTGTPIRAVGKGVVSFAGAQRGYGNVVEITHAGGKSTLYAHMSRIDVRKGQQIDQGSRVGLVGRTGWATGPHLHFEFRVNGAHQNPLLIARQSESESVAVHARGSFDQIAQDMRHKLSAASVMALARME